MISGIGIDIIELNRIKTIIDRQPKFIQRILTENELLVFEKLSAERKVEFLAGRFAAKEAYAKANGTGIGNQLSFLDIEIQPDSFGKPQIVAPNNKGVHLSISHSREYAVAQVVIEGCFRKDCCFSN
ncbi:holo-ACP synthase [Pseudoneobacillus rhizosphaerae]|uniref:Holo-[acyl-carrier-protein] synthase n=1 Tax=Pseudoneobacillus rhizosphaerae TaxID=2880968 RepID=A0A9C7LBM3_9BACI|nr:holo-ACP synthase [Pseudoneobacillus rhizosphaerae]CAG9610306.1 Holo-[acyl-carrier-protein] synthase [Pseudoneobacillus rhizosphaerae]